MLDTGFLPRQVELRCTNVGFVKLADNAPHN